MRRLIALLLLLLIPGFALAQYPSPVFQNATVNGALNAIGGGILAGPYTGAPVLSGLWTFNGGLGTNAAAITGGSINGTPIGATTPATGAFTTIGATGAVTLSATGIALAITNSATIGGTLTINPSGANPLNITNALFSLTGSGSAGYTFSALTTGNMVFQINSQSVLTLRQATSGVNGIVITEGATGAGAQIQQGGDATGTLKLGAGAGGNTGTLQSLVPLLVQGPISFGLSQTLVSGSGFGAVGSVNPAPLWYNSILQGTINTGASSPFEFQVTDKMVMPNPLPIWAFTDNTAAGYDGARTPFSITLVKAAATASGGTFGSNTVLTVTQSVAVGDGGTQAAPNGVNTATNFVLRCYTGDWLSSCVQSEWDLALQSGTHALQKTSMGLHYSQFDGQHASGTTALPLRWTDATLQMTAATNIGNGTGKGIVMILLGDHSQDLPWDNTPGIGTALMAVQMNDSQNFPTATESGAQIDDGFRLVDVFARNNFINNGAFHVDGQGNVYSCLATVKATSTGSSIDVTGQTEVSATVTTPVTTGAVVGSSMTDSLGGIWQVTGVTGTFPNTNPTAVTLLRPACVGTPPANPITASMSGGGVSGGVPPVSLNVTWSGAQNTLTLQPSGGPIMANLSASKVTATGSTTARTLADRFAQVLNVQDYILPTDTDATAGIGRAVAQALSLGVPVVLNLPCGTYNVSSAIAITTTANQGLFIKGDASSCVTIKQTTDADLFDVNLNGYGAGIFAGGAFGISGVTMTMSATSSTRNAVSITTTGVSGDAGPPMYLHDLNFKSPSTSDLWGNEILINNVSGPLYIDKINGYIPGAPISGSHISINGASGAYTTAVTVRDVFLVGGMYGIQLGNYLQGVHIANVEAVGTAYALYSAPTAGVNLEIQVADSYLDGKTYLSPTSPGTLSAVQISHTYFDALNGVNANETHVAIANVGILSLDSNQYAGVPSIAGLTALSISGTGVVPGQITNQKFTGYTNTSTCMNINVSTYPMLFSGTQMRGCTTDVVDTSSVHNLYMGSIWENAPFAMGGGPADGIQFSPGASLVNLLAGGPDSSVAYLFSAKGLPNIDFIFNDGLSRRILQLIDSGSAVSGVGFNMKQGLTATSPQLSASSVASNIMLGLPGSLAASATGGLIQIPYTSAAPTGTPATTGGATLFYNTASHNLNIYDPVAASWYHVALTAGGG